MLSALYYPFSRCIDPSALKQLLLVFDSVTFLDPVDDDEWRAKLFRDLEITEDQRFATYRELEGPLITLRDEGAIVLRRPEELNSFESEATSASALADLADPIWCEVARQPAKFGLPHQNRAADGRATWQIFPAKLPSLLRDRFHGTELGRHVVWSSRKDTAWTVSYEAGSAATLNLHLAAAGELSLAPVTDSALHHRLLIRKIVRSATPESEWSEPASPMVEAVANRLALQLIETLMPRSALFLVTFEKILQFREQTQQIRAAMMAELRSRLAPAAKLTSINEISSQQQSIAEAIMKEVREYRASLLATRDKLWPGLVKTSTTAVAGGSAGAVALQFLIGGPLAVLAGSIAGASLGVLQAALEQRADANKTARAASSSVAYLSRVTAL
jgi:hypothetical protein